MKILYLIVYRWSDAPWATWYFSALCSEKDDAMRQAGKLRSGRSKIKPFVEVLPLN